MKGKKKGGESSAPEKEVSPCEDGKGAGELNDAAGKHTDPGNPHSPELLALRERAERELDTTVVMIVALDTEGRVSMINRRGCEILRAEEKDILGGDWFDNFVPVGPREELRNLFHLLLKGELTEAEYIENTVIDSSGEERLIHWHNTVLRDPDGNGTGTFSSGEDVTEERLAGAGVRGQARRTSHSE